MPKNTIKRRNPLANVVMLRKGGVHEKSRSAKRQADKRALHKELKKYNSDQGNDRYFFAY